jgi:hypothetical protein
MRRYCIVIVPSRWRGSETDLVTILARETGVSTPHVMNLIAKGPVTVKSDLDKSAGERALKKFVKLGLPAVMRSDSSRTEEEDLPKAVETHRPQESSHLQPLKHTDPVPTFPGMPASTLLKRVDATIAQSDRKQAPGGLPAPAPRIGESDSIEFLGLDSIAADALESLDSWGIEETDSASAQNEGQKAGDADRKEKIRTTPDTSTDSSRATAPQNTTFQGDTAPGRRPADNQQPDRTGPSTMPGDTPPEKVAKQADHPWGLLFPDLTPPIAPQGQETPPRPQTNSPALPPRIDPESTEPAAIKTAPLTSEPRARNAFLETKLESAMTPKEEPGAHAPVGFEDRSHIPWLAGILSLFAPGAGQVYNGQDELGVSHLKKWFLFKPWFLIESHKQAVEYGENVSSYHAPFPHSGSFRRALAHVTLTWIGLVLLGLMASVGWQAIQGRNTLEESSTEDHERRIALLRLAGNQQAQQTEIRSMELVTGLIRKRQASRERFTVDEDERVRLLFERGYSYCQELRHDLCESAMRKVVKLSPGHRKALRLQAWASLQKNAREPTLLPEFKDDFSINLKKPSDSDPNRSGPTPIGGVNSDASKPNDAGGSP